MKFKNKRAAIYLLSIILTLMTLCAYTGQSVRAATVNCQLTVPPNALTPKGLATPWQLQAPCHEADTNAAVFVQAAIFAPGTKSFYTYNPLVIDAGTTPAVAPQVPTLPVGAVVALFGGGDDSATTLIGASNQCVNGADGRVFGQVFFCGAAHFFSVVNNAHVAIPALGRTYNGALCPTVRSFKIVDQDQSDNLQTKYIVTATGQTAQDTAANRATLGTDQTIVNPSDNLVLTNFVDPALGCKPWKAPDLADNGHRLPLQALDELQAAALQPTPVALIPAGDPMVGPNDLNMLNAYRINVDQPFVSSLSQASTLTYCKNLKAIGSQFLANNKTVFQASPSPASGTNLYDFLMGRFQASLMILAC